MLFVLVLVLVMALVHLGNELHTVKMHVGIMNADTVGEFKYWTRAASLYSSAASSASVARRVLRGLLERPNEGFQFQDHFIGKDLDDASRERFRDALALQLKQLAGIHVSWQRKDDGEWVLYASPLRHIFARWAHDHALRNDKWEEMSSRQKVE
jgi:hypothetical protein